MLAGMILTFGRTSSLTSVQFNENPAIYNRRHSWQVAHLQ